MNRKIVISGGTGAVGSALTALLIKNGYEVHILTRNSTKYTNSQNIIYHTVNTSNVQDTIKIFEGSYSVVNLAGAGVADKRWSESYKNEIYNSRIIMTKHLVDSVNGMENPPHSFISASAIGIYGDRGDERLNEHSHIADSFLAKVCRDWEAEADKVKSNVRVVKGRIGIVLDKKTGALPKLALPVKLFVGGPIGSGKQWMSWIHIEDLAEMFLWAIENDETEGIYNFVSPNAVTMKEFASTLAKVLHRPAIFKVPAIVIKLILGESSAVVLASQQVHPTESMHLGFKFKYENLKDALDNILN